MAGRIRRGTLTIGTSVADVANFQWNDNYEFDRSKGDEEMSGTPVEMSRGGSGSFELLKGSVQSGYATSDIVFTYNEVEVTAGVETVTEKTQTFDGGTFNQGGNVGAEGRGSLTISFEYSTRTES